MKKIFRTLAVIVLLGALCFLAGEWPEGTPRNKVVRYDSGALATILVCGLYLKKTEDKKNG